MRWVTRKPPNTFTAASATAIVKAARAPGRASPASPAHSHAPTRTSTVSSPTVAIGGSGANITVLVAGTATPRTMPRVAGRHFALNDRVVVAPVNGKPVVIGGVLGSMGAAESVIGGSDIAPGAIVLGHMTRCTLSYLRFRQEKWRDIRVDIEPART